MEILFFRFNNIFEPDVLSSFQKLGIHVITEFSKDGTGSYSSDTVDIVASHILDHQKNKSPLLFVFSINFNPAISEVCQKLNTLYVCWSVDCPVIELFSASIRNTNNRIFLFDFMQYQRFSRYNPDSIFYLPLGSNTDRLARTVSSINSDDIAKYSSDISFVGSLYNEINPLNKLSLPSNAKEEIDSLISAQLSDRQSFFIENALSDTLIKTIKGNSSGLPLDGFVEPIDRYTIANLYIGMQLAEVERFETLSRLSNEFNINLYTKSDSSRLKKIHNKGSAHTYNVMPKVFHLSKINLNITMRPIQTGLSLRIYDVLGSGGFLITNYQAEIDELFEAGNDLVVYNTLDELVDKCHYYLTHDDERRQIALNGYHKVQQLHTCDQRVTHMIRTIFSK